MSWNMNRKVHVYWRILNVAHRVCEQSALRGSTGGPFEVPPPVLKKGLRHSNVLEHGSIMG